MPKYLRRYPEVEQSVKSFGLPSVQKKHGRIQMRISSYDIPVEDDGRIGPVSGRVVIRIYEDEVVDDGAFSPAQTAQIALSMEEVDDLIAAYRSAVYGIRYTHEEDLEKLKESGVSATPDSLV